MGTSFSNRKPSAPRKPKDSLEYAEFLQLDRPSMSVQLQMNCIITYWIRNTSVKYDVYMFPMDIVHIIVDTYCYQPVFDMEHMHKRSDPEQYCKANLLRKPASRRLNCDYLMKILLIGQPQIGRTCLLLRYCDDMFRNNHNLAIEFKIKAIELSNNKKIKLQIWNPYLRAIDRSGGDLYQRFLRHADAVIFVYDMTRESSLEWLAPYNEMVDEYEQRRIEKMLIGTKSDCINNHELRKLASKFAKERGMVCYMETSAKNGDNVENAFLSIVEHTCRNKMDVEKRLNFPFFSTLS